MMQYHIRMAGVCKDDHRILDLTEPKSCEDTGEKGVKLANVTCGNPYYNSHVNRPYDTGFYTPPEHQLVGVSGF